MSWMVEVPERDQDLSTPEADEPPGAKVLTLVLNEAEQLRLLDCLYLTLSDYYGFGDPDEEAEEIRKLMNRIDPRWGAYRDEDGTPEWNASVGCLPKEYYNRPRPRSRERTE